MIQILFKNLDKSELAKEAAVERLDLLRERFPDLQESRLKVTLGMENSPAQAGPDLFTVKVHCLGGRYKDLTIQKDAPSLYVALADVVDHLHEMLNRYGDRSRVKQRRVERQTLEV